MRLDRVVLALVVSLWAGGVLAADASSPKDAPVFEIQVVITDRGQAIFNAWDYAAGSSSRIESITIAPRRKVLSALVLFKGCKADTSGNCNADVDIVAYDPSGKVYGSMPGVELWRAKAPPASGVTQLSRSFLGLLVEPEDPVGTYRITAVARDKNAKTEARSAVQFQVGM